LKRQLTAAWWPQLRRAMSRDPRWGRLTRWVARAAPGAFSLFWLLFWVISRNPAFALIAAGLVTGAVLSVVVAVGRTAWGSRPAKERQLGLVVGLFGLPGGLMAALLLVAFGVPLPWAAAAGVSVGGAMAAYYSRGRYTEQLRGLLNQFPLSVDRRDDAFRQLAGARRYIAPTRFPTGLKAEQMTAHRDAYDANARLNDARARMRLAASEADHDQLLAALDGVRDTLEDQGLDPALALLAARDLVSAESALAQRSHERTRYAAAVSLYRRLAQENPAFDWAQIAMHEQLADYQAFEMMLAGSDFKAARVADDEDAMSQAFSRLLDTYHAVERELTVVIHLTEEDAEILPQYLCHLGIHLCLSSSLLDEDRTDEGISMIRSALTLRSARKGELRRFVELTLVISLLDRYRLRADDPAVAGGPDESDLDEAFPLLLRLVREPAPVKARAWQLMLELVAMDPRQRTVTVPQAARKAFAAALPEATIDLLPITERFAAWTESRDVPAGLRAEAYSMSLVAMERDAMRRELPADRLRLLSESQHVGAEAGFWLAETERAREAVVAAEQSRGILLSRLTGGLDPAISAKLTAAGRPDLVADYLDALRARAEAYRRQFGADADESGPGAVSTRGILRGETFYPAGVLSPLEDAHAELTRLNREITAITGTENSADQPSYADIQRAALAAPVVYLGAASGGGFALIVRNHGAPTCIRLPAMSRGALTGHIDAFRQRPPANRAVLQCVGWLAGTALADLLPAIAHDPEIALVPLGALNALPVNGALLHATRDRAAGPVAIRYLPNARAATQTTSRWPRVHAGTTAMLVIDAAAPREHKGLRLARGEAAALARQYDASRLEDATTAAAIAALPGAKVVQFLCHGQADLANPLAGGLVLADGMLTVQQLFARPPTGRQLMIVAACESHMTGMDAPDEIVGLPTALYQAGASGIIAAQWQVDERAAVLALRHFHERFRDGASPVRALTAAQHWLSTVTQRELINQHPDLFRFYHPASHATPNPARDDDQPYANPAYWSAFSYTGI
jgi:CHAT domain